MVASVDPSARTEPGLAATDDIVAETGPGTNVIVAVCFKSQDGSVTSTALNVTDSAAVSVAVNLTTPSVPHGALAGEMTAWVGVTCLTTIVFAFTGRPY